MRAFCFPGQGPQEPALLNELLAFQNSRSLLNCAREITGFPINELAGQPADQFLEALRKNEVASLITVLHAVASLHEISQSHTADYLTGYSVGQYVALHAAQCLDLENMIRLVWERSLLMNVANEDRPGRMAAVIGLPEEQVRAICETTGACIANLNSRGQYTIAGTEKEIQSAIIQCQHAGAHKCIPVNAEGAWHCHHMEGAIVPFAQLLSQIEFRAPAVPVIDNVTGKLFGDDVPGQLVKHLHQPVQWEAGIRSLMAAGCKEFIEIGFGNMLSKFGFFISRDVRFQTSTRLLAASQTGAKRCAA